MIVDDGFSVLDTDCGILGERKAVNEVKVVKVPIDHIFPNPYQPRKTFDDSSLEDLSASIAQYGVLQPLLVAPAENGKYLLIAGERRLRASKLAKLTEVPVIISEYTSQQIAEIALIENLQREDLHYLEEAEGYENFGRRCDLQIYIRLGALLSQNLRKGTKGLSELLKLESIQAFEERKARAKRLGEEAGTKLLLPMFLMLVVVLIIVIVPAFLTMQI